MRRREFIALMGGASAWPLAARAQQAAMPVCQVLVRPEPNGSAQFGEAFRRGLSEIGTNGF
jgi:putative ABC transport system substrate-binding protein